MTALHVTGFQEVKQKNPTTGIAEKFPQLTVKGVGYDRSLGGLEFQLRLRDHLAKNFNAMKKTSTDVFTNKRAMAKLFKEAGRLKNVLSANVFHFAQVRQEAVR
jgi:hypoxia up-regulated 1